MTAIAHDTTMAVPARVVGGVPMALLSAASFSLSGPLARPLLDAGWSPGATVLVRVALGGLLLLPFAVRALRGRWWLLRRNAALVLGYGLLPVAGSQLCYFSAVQHMQVGPALMIEYAAPAVVVLWLWWRHAQRPGLLTVAGAVAAAAGLLLVLDVFSGGGPDPVGVAWALAAMVGVAVYFVVSADDRSGLPPVALAGAGLVVGSVVLGLAGVVGVLPMRAATTPVQYAGLDLPWWAPLLGLGLVASAVAWATGIVAARALGSRVASFVALSEVVCGVLWSWALLGELPQLVQLLGGLLILAGVVGVKLGEPVSAGPAA
jgi:drug/metabolite transporter (DMT)-like permease